MFNIIGMFSYPVEHVMAGSPSGNFAILWNRLPDSSWLIAFGGSFPPQTSLVPSRGEGRGRGGIIVWGCGVIGGPVLEEHVTSATPKGLVGSFDEFRWGDVRSG